MAPAGIAQTFDAQVGFIEVTQAMPNTSLTAGRSTFVRVEALLTNPPSNPVGLDGIMRVFVDGEEAPNSPVYSDNGPFPAETTPNFNISRTTLNFVYLPPASNNVVFTIDLNPAGPNFVPESNTANNTKSTPVMNFQVRAVPEFMYVPIDYRPNGGPTPNLPPENLIEPGVGDNFIQAIFPAKDIYYHRTNAPSKLWTGNLSTLNAGEDLLNSMLADLQLIEPDPDFYYGWVAGSLWYNGWAFSNSPVSMGNTEEIRHQRTYAYCVGLNTGLSASNGSILERGVDTEHHLNITLGLPVIKKSDLLDIMDAGELTEDAWVRATTYEYFFNHPKFAPAAPLTYQPPSVFVAGTWHRQSGALAVDHLFEVPTGHPTAPASETQADFGLAFYRGTALAEWVYVTSGTGDATGSDSHYAPPELTFHAVVPIGPAPFDRLVITPMGRAQGEPLILDRSVHAPEIAFLEPGPDGDVSAGRITVSWSGFDADNDLLTYYLRYTHDGSTFTSLATGVSGTQWSVDMRELPAFDEGVGYFELFASDGLNTASAVSPTLHGSGALFAAGSNPPWVHVSTPDVGQGLAAGRHGHPACAGLGPGGPRAQRQPDGLDLGPRRPDRHRADDVRHQPIGRDARADRHRHRRRPHDRERHDHDRDHRPRPAGRAERADRLLHRRAPPPAAARECSRSPARRAPPRRRALTVTASTVEGIKDGLYFYGTNGPQANPWGNGTSYQCVVPPTIRSPTLNSGGTLFACDGSVSRDMNAYWTANPIKNPGAGAQVNLQFWYRDPLNTSNQTTSLSDALEFTLEP